MFGFITPNQAALATDRLDRYRTFYCGLCQTLGERYGLPARLALTYDMTFLVVLLGSLYEPEETSGRLRCAPHPVKPHAATVTRFSSYAAALNVLLAYHNCEDDWRDEKNAVRHGEALLLKKHLPAIETAYPRQYRAVTDGLERLKAAEAASADIDTAVNAFAALMGELFVYDEGDRWADTLRTIGASLGRFICALDAYLDADADEKQKRFNPLLPLRAEADFDARCKEMLTLFIGEAASAFERLPLVQDADILRNILYSGVWTRYAIQRQKQENNTAKAEKRRIRT